MPESSVAVYARLRPCGEDERGDIKIKGTPSPKIVATRNLEFSLEHVFDQFQPQDEVFRIAAQGHITSVLEGFNACLIAYGQTGSGKTHTMFGPERVVNDYARCDRSLHGIVPRACHELFERIGKKTVRVSYVEVYNDKLHDLLSGVKGLQMRESPDAGIVVDNLTVEEVESVPQVMSALHRGNSHRVVAAMKMNARSSRGHAILGLHVIEIGQHETEKTAKLNLVDLAGMESSKKSWPPPPP